MTPADGFTIARVLGKTTHIGRLAVGAASLLCLMVRALHWLYGAGGIGRCVISLEFVDESSV
jgi:hypothetical protein